MADPQLALCSDLQYVPSMLLHAKHQKLFVGGLEVTDWRFSSSLRRVSFVRLAVDVKSDILESFRCKCCAARASPLCFNFGFELKTNKVMVLAW